MKYSCASCSAAEVCRYTFGDFHDAKSHGGVGCNYPITVTPDHIRAMRMAKASAGHNADGGRADASRSDEPKQSSLWHKYIVTHRLKEYPTVAHTEAQAISFVRFKLYGARPADTLPPFSCRLAGDERTKTDKRTGANGRLSLDAIRARIGRMGA